MTYEHNITLSFDINKEKCSINYLCIPTCLVKPLSKLLKLPIEISNPNFELIISNSNRRFVANVLQINSKFNGLIGSNSILKSLNLEAKKPSEFIFYPISNVKIAEKIKFSLIMDKDYDPEWLSFLYSSKSNSFDSPENIIRLTFSDLLICNNNIFEIYLLGKLCTLSVSIHPSDGDYPFRIDDRTEITFDLPYRLKTPDKVSKIKLYGMDNILNILKWRVLIPLSYPEYHIKNNIFPPKGVLLWGPPGCGKSYIAKYIYDLYINDELKDFLILDKLNQYTPLEVVLTSSTKLLSDHPGQSVSNITEIFNTSNNPKIIFIDEIDGIASKRDTNQNISTLLALLCEMDSCINSNSNICIIGLTNRPNDLDSAIRRPGRFDYEIHVGVPNSSQRFELLKGILGEFNCNLTTSEIELINSQCSAFVASDLRGLINKTLNDKSEKYLQGKCTDISITLDDILEAKKGLSPSGLREIYVEIPYTRWDDIGGYEDVKLLLKQSVEWPYKMKDLLDKYGIKPPKGILLYGPPGCSKTMMAKAIATSSHMNFISIKGPELFSKWVGESERSIRQLFFIARSNSPCVIFFDEIDSIAKSRQSDGVSEVGNRVLSQLLNEMDGINTNGELVIIGATNRPDVLDPALLRPGRFDRLIYVRLPDPDARKNIFKINFSKLKLDPSLEIDRLIEKLSERTHGYSGAEIEAICRESALRSIGQFIENKTNIGISIDDIEYAMGNIKCRTKDVLLEIYNRFNS